VSKAIPISDEQTTAIISQIDRSIASFIESKEFPKQLHNAIAYSVLNGGKRLRPVLAWYASMACGSSGKDALPAGIAVELIHAFSLVHDDLPALDNDELRRGKPTLHIHTNEPMAILAGDAMLSLAYEAIIDTASADLTQKLLAELALGTRSMIIGQVFDTLGGLPDEITPEMQLRLIHKNKTGALLVASCRMGALCGGASKEQLVLITEFAESIGLQFQIVDDLLDIEGCPTLVGKALGKDAQAGKITYPAVLGVERSREIAQELSAVANRALDGLEKLHSGGAESLRDLLTRLEHRKQ